MGGTLRTPETEDAYRRVKADGHLKDGCPLCKAESLKEFTEWRIIGNTYPYDLIAKVHHMLVPKRHASDSELTESEQKEFAEIKESYVSDTYEFMIEPVRKQKSIPGHSHLHLLISKHQ